MYYTLLSKEPGQKWYIEFGDHNKLVVAEEAADIHLSGTTADLRIIKTPTARQSQIDEAVKTLNNKGT